MIEETRVNFRIAQALKKLGFPQDYDVNHGPVYNDEDFEHEYEVQRMVLQTEIIKEGTLFQYPFDIIGPKSYAPTLSLVQKWFRETHNVEIIVEPATYDKELEKISVYHFSLWLEGHRIKFTGIKYSTYEAALEYGIERCVKYLLYKSYERN